MRKRIEVLTAVGIVAVLCSGCATILSGSSQNITITSEPPGAHVKIAQQSGTTPAILQVPKGKDYPIEVTHGTDTRVLPLQRTFDAISVLNIFFWPGFIVDAVTGAITKYDPDTYSVDFTGR